MKKVCQAPCEKNFLRGVDKPWIARAAGERGTRASVRLTLVGVKAFAELFSKSDSPKASRPQATVSRAKPVNV